MGCIPCWGRFFEIVRPFLLRDTTSKIILEYYDIIFFVYILYKYEDFQQPVGGWCQHGQKLLILKILPRHLEVSSWNLQDGNFLLFIP